MSLLYEEKIAKRFAKIKPVDVDFYTELDSALVAAFFGEEKDNPATVKNYDKIVVSIAYILICYGMFELHSTICACLMSKVHFELVSKEDVEEALMVMKLGAKVIEEKELELYGN